MVLRRFLSVGLCGLLLFAPGMRAQVGGDVAAVGDATAADERAALREMVEQLTRERDALQAKVGATSKLRSRHARPTKVGVIPVVGMVGVDATADAMAKELDRIVRAKADTVVLYVDSPGGLVDEMHRIVTLIEDAPEPVTFVAYVKQAISAAAVVAVACERIVVAPEAVIGAAVPFKVGPQGMPGEVEEKMRSIFRAQVRHAAEVGGHSPLLAQGMEDLDLQLSIIEDPNNPPMVIEGATRGRLIKPKGKVLTLTATEAINVGLAEAMCGDDELLALLDPIDPAISNDKTWKSVYVTGLRRRIEAVEQRIVRVERGMADVRKAYAQGKQAVRIRGQGKTGNARRAEQQELDATLGPIREQGETMLRTLKEQRKQLQKTLKETSGGGVPFKPPTTFPTR